MKQSGFIDLGESSSRYFSEISKGLLAEHYIEIENHNVFRDKSKPLMDIVEKYGSDTVLSHIRSLGVNPSNCKFDFSKGSHIEIFLELAGWDFAGFIEIGSEPSHMMVHGSVLLSVSPVGDRVFIPMGVVDKIGLSCVGFINTLSKAALIELQFLNGPTKYDIFKCSEVKPPNMPVILFQDHLYETDYIEHAKYWRLEEDWHGN